MTTIPEALTLALRHHQAGQFAEAEQIYWQVLAVEPGQADALHLLGVLAHQVGRHELAIEYIQRAIALNGVEGSFHNNLGEVYRALKQIPQAIACYRRALELRSDYAEAHNNLGIALREQNELDEAIACCHRALKLKPDYAEAYNNLGIAQRDKERLGEAVVNFQQAIKLLPELAEAHSNLGSALREQGEMDKAVVCFRQALSLKPNYVEAHNNLGTVFHDQGKHGEAIACYREALRINPDYVEAHHNLGIAFHARGELDEAFVAYRHALRLRPSFAKSHNSLGIAFLAQRKFAEALPCFRQALQLKPDYYEAFGNLLLALPYWNQTTPAELLSAHAEFNQRFAVPLAPREPAHPNDRSEGRKLRVGYVSPDFRDHVVGRSLLPLFHQHDHREFEVFCYSHVRSPDAFTNRFQAAADAWLSIVGLSDEAAARKVREDRIDILVDLAMHTADNRLLLLALQPAPVQVTFAGLLATTGLTAIDYRLTDPYLDPPGLHDHCYSEESFRLPHSFWCYDPPGPEPVVNPLPARERGYVTFGCLSAFGKVNDSVLRLWAQVLRDVTGSRLVVLAPEGMVRQATLNLLAQHGVAPERVTLASRQPHQQYLEMYHQIDIGLDTFPYNGHATSLDSYWMGVPVVTLVGSSVVGRAGFSQLMNLKLPELIAHAPEDFVRVAVDLAQDLPRLAELRTTLRQRMERSPLMDAVGFTRGIEAAYRAMWRRWCAK